MPQLKNLSCSIQWSESGVPFQEYGTFYGDGVVETFIIVPNRPQSFTIHLRSRGFIYEGLAIVVFADGNYQTNRNRVNLVPARKDQSLSKTEVDFLIRQKEKPLGDGIYMGREWRFDDHNIVSELPEGVKDNHFDNLGMIEVLVLRCRTRSPDEAPASPASSGADSDIFCDRSPYVSPDAAIETTAPVQDDEDTGGFINIFDGADDRGNMFGLDGSVPPLGNGWFGNPQYRFPGYSHDISNRSHFNTTHNTENRQDPPSAYALPHPDSTAPRLDGRVRFDFGPQGPPPSLHDPRMDPIESKPPSYDRHRYPLLSLHGQNSALRYPQPSFPTNSSCRYPSAPCHCGSPCHKENANTNRYNDPLGPMGSAQSNPSSHEPPYQGYANTHFLGSDYQPAAIPTAHMYPFRCQQHHSQAIPPYNNPSLYAQWPNVVPVPHNTPMHLNWQNQQPYSVPPTNNGTHTKPVNGNQQQQAGTYQDRSSEPNSNAEGKKSGSGSSNDQYNTSNDQSQTQEQPWNGDNSGDNNIASTAWPDSSNDANTQGDQSNNAGNENSGWSANNTSNNAAEIDWNKSNGNDNNASSDGNLDWGVKKTNEDNNNNNGNDKGNDDNQYNNSNNKYQDNTNGYSDQNLQDAANPQTPPPSVSSNVRPLFGPHGQYYTWKPKTIDAPSPDAEEEPRYDVPRSIVDKVGTSKQVQPGQGYLYCKKRSVPEYIDDMKEPYARFVFKYRTKEQVKMELGVEIETEPTGDESIQELQNLNKQDLIDMLIRAKGALGGKVPSPPLKPITSGGEVLNEHRLPVPVEPPNHQFLKYQMPPVRNFVSGGTQGNFEGVSTSGNSSSNNNENAQLWSGNWTTGEKQQNQVKSWDGVADKDADAQKGAVKDQGGTQAQSQAQDSGQPEYIPIPLPGTPPPQPQQTSNPSLDPSGRASKLVDQSQPNEAEDVWKMQNVPSAASSPASVRPPFNPSNSVVNNWEEPQEGAKSTTRKPREPVW